MLKLIFNNNNNILKMFNNFELNVLDSVKKICKDKYRKYIPIEDERNKLSSIKNYLLDNIKEKGIFDIIEKYYNDLCNLHIRRKLHSELRMTFQYYKKNYIYNDYNNKLYLYEPEYYQEILHEPNMLICTDNNLILLEEMGGYQYISDDEYYSESDSELDIDFYSESESESNE